MKPFKETLVIDPVLLVSGYMVYAGQGALRPFARLLVAGVFFRGFFTVWPGNEGEY